MDLLDENGKANLRTYRTRLIQAFVKDENARIFSQVAGAKMQSSPTLGVQLLDFDADSGDARFHYEEFSVCGGCEDSAKTLRNFRSRMQRYCEDPEALGGGTFLSSGVEVEMPEALSDQQLAGAQAGGRPLPACMVSAGRGGPSL